MVLDLKGIKAVIFDMDGTLVDNMNFHKQAWRGFIKYHGIELTEEVWKEKISGQSNDRILKVLFGEELTDEDVKKHAADKEAVYREIYKPHLKEVDGLIDLIKQLKGKGIKLAVATTGPLKNREFVLGALKIMDIFDSVLGGEDIEKGKPDPEIFLKTAKNLGVKPKECLVFEDSPPGVEAGKRAGMRVIGILTTHNKKELSQADQVASNFKFETDS